MVIFGERQPPCEKVPQIDQQGRSSHDVNPGGWSASGQPVDQIHSILRSKLDMVDAGDAGCIPDIRSRTDGVISLVVAHTSKPHKEICLIFCKQVRLTGLIFQITSYRVSPYYFYKL